VVLPLIGSRQLYVAVEGSTATQLATRVAAVAATTGLTGVTTYQPSAPPAPVLDPPISGWPPVLFPTHGTVSTYVGFALLTTSPGLWASVYLAAAQVVGVTGVAIVTAVGTRVLVEASGGTVDDVSAVLQVVAGISGVVAADTAIGATELGFGLDVE
jgi:hypothetical protein